MAIKMYDARKSVTLQNRLYKTPALDYKGSFVTEGCTKWSLDKKSKKGSLLQRLKRETIGR